MSAVAGRVDLERGLATRTDRTHQYFCDADRSSGGYADCMECIVVLPILTQMYALYEDTSAAIAGLQNMLVDGQRTYLR